MLRRTAMIAGLLAAMPLAAQTAPPPTPPAPSTSPEVGANDILVTGRRAEPSNWREAETPHAVVLSDGSEADLIRIARNLERLHFLLSMLLGRVDKPDDTVKLRVTLIGDVAEFTAMGLRNLRWQQGPFPDEFGDMRYYDPRDDGAVMATSRIDQKVITERGISWERFQGMVSALSDRPADGTGNQGMNGYGGSSLIGLSNTTDRIGLPNEKSVVVPSDYLLYAGFAQHYLTTYFPAAYPRWYLDGFGQVFATMQTHGENELDYGRVPIGTTSTLDRYGGYPLAQVFDGSYLNPKASRRRWTPTHAWMLTHFLFFSDAWRPRLRQYLLAYANGATPAEAAKALGDPAVLTAELRRYYRGKKPFDKMAYPADRIPEPQVRRLTKGQAAFIKGRLELGSRVDLAAEPSVGATADETAKLAKEHRQAIATRDKWLEGLRRDAARYPADVEAQLLLAEAECRTGHPAECRVAAEATLKLRPGDTAALAWKGSAMALAARAAPMDQRPAELRAAREVIAGANRADTEAVLPLLAYYRSYQGDTAPPIAVDALAGAVTRVPNAPVARLALGTEYARRGLTDEARRTLGPVALGGYDTPERLAAQQAIAGAVK
ncbi:hypothetical protein ACT009_14170 [Sphingomonas sp. Tas61C01]|uniref:hypothetical protein n=1 Tax=Sphingomonas sp. Tas61C01 TaxID=3458297 RepID=UPI00403E3984